MAVASVAWAVLASEKGARASEADDQFAVAASHYKHQEWKLAVEEFRTFLAKYPDERRANECVFFFGEALRQLGKFDEARQQFQNYASREPKGKHAVAALFGAAEAAYLAGNFVAAKPDLAGFLEKYPDDPLNAFTLSYLGDVTLSTGDVAAAVGYFRKALKQFPDGRLQDDCRFGLARALEKQNQSEEAAQLYAAVAGKPGSPLADAAQLHLGALQYALGKYDAAQQSFAAFDGHFAKSAWQPNARLGCGLALLKLNRPGEAVKQFDAALAAPSADEELLQQAVQGKVQAALQMKDYAAIDRETTAFEKRFPKSPLRNDVRRMLARSLVERKEHQRAVALLESLVAAVPAGGVGQQDLENRYLLAVGYEGMKRYNDALAALLPVVDNAKGPLKFDAQLTQGSLLIALKRYAEAIAPLEAFLAERPSGDVEVKARGELAICYARTKQIDKAKKCYADLIAKHAEHALIAPTTERLAEAAFDADDAAWAAELSKRLAAAGGSAEYEFKGKLQLGWSQFKAGKSAEAAATFDELLKKNPPEAIAAEAAFVRGRILQVLGQDEAALAMYNLVIERCPASQQRCDALLAAARLQEKLKQPAAAAATYQRLAKDYPRFAKLDAAVYEWAWAMQEVGKPEDAAGLFERLHKEHPQSRFWADATCRLAQQALDAKDYERAGALVDEVLAVKPAAEGGKLAGQPDAKVRQYAMRLRGEIAVAKTDWSKVREAYEALVEQYPDSQRRLLAEYWVAESYYRQGDYPAAVARFEQLAERMKENREPWMAVIRLRQAQSLAQQGQWADAQAIAAKIEKDFPNFAQQYEVDYLLGRCLANQAEFDAARKAYHKAIYSAAGAKTETAAMAQWMIGETFFHQKNYKEALQEYLRLEILYAFPTWQAAALLQAGKCRERLGEAQEAAKLYRKVVKSYPTTSFAKDAASELARLEPATSRH